MELAAQQRLEIGRAVDQAHDMGLLSDKDWTSIHELNAKEGNIIELRNAIERATQKSGKRGVLDWLTAMLAYGQTGDVTTAALAGAGKQLLTSPWMRSQAAISLNNLGKHGVPSLRYTPQMGAAYFTASQPQIQEWYDDVYGGLLGQAQRGK